MYSINGIFALGALQIVGVIIACIALYVLLVAIRWKLLKKAGEAGWKALIPVYNQYMVFEICWSTKWFWIMLGAAIAISFGMLIPLLGPILFMAGVLVMMFITVFECLQLAKAFGKDEAYGIGLAFFGPVFEFILAFDGNVKYVGPQQDPQFFSSVSSDIRDEFDSMKKEPERPMNFDPYTGQPLNQQNVEEQPVADVVDTDDKDDDIQVIGPGQLK